MNFKDLTGKKFNKLTVIKRVENSKDNSVQWLCECECGNESVVRGSLLKNNHTKSCGCLKQNEVLIGKKFNRLTVIKRVDSDKYGSSKFECICDCGTVGIYRGTSVKNGRTKSCGCLLYDKLSKDLTNMKFGRLTVIKKIDDKRSMKEKRYYWLCKCKCGGEIVTRGSSLMYGSVNSCGCLSKELLSKRMELLKNIT